MQKNFVTWLAICASLAACGAGRDTIDARNQSRLSSFVLENFPLKADGPQWTRLDLSFKPFQSSSAPFVQKFESSAFRSGRFEEAKVTVKQGVYNILLEYFDSQGKVAYKSCKEELERKHEILGKTYAVTIEVCRIVEKDGKKDEVPAGEVKLNELNDLTIETKLRDESAQTNPGGQQNANPSTCTNASGQTLANQDNVYGQCVDQQNSYYVKDGEIYARGQMIQLRGLNWFGFDNFPGGGDPDKDKLSLGGLWNRKVEDVIVQLKGLGFNALRIPLSPQAFNDSTPGRFGYAKAIDNLKDLLRLSDIHGFHILLDIHTCDARAGHTTGTPKYCQGYYPDNWLKDLKTLAELAKNYRSVVGIDLYNEPYQLSWDEWRGMVNQGAETILKTNPRTLIFVEGIGDKSAYGRYTPFWGGNLFEGASKPVNVPASRLVYSPHVYGPGTYADHGYFNTSEFPNNMPGIWDEQFGSLRSKGYAIAVGEFGGFYREKDKLWQDAFVGYLKNRNIKHFFYWSLNPESGDTGGLLNSDWSSVNQDKLQLLKRLMPN